MIIIIIPIACLHNIVGDLEDLPLFQNADSILAARKYTNKLNIPDAKSIFQPFSRKNGIIRLNTTEWINLSKSLRYLGHNLICH